MANSGMVIDMREFDKAMVQYAAASGKDFKDISNKSLFDVSLRSIKHMKKAKISMNIETRSVNASLSNYSGEIAVLKAHQLREQGKKNEADRVLQKAREDFKRALKHDPSYKRAERNLTKLVMGLPITL